LNTLLNKRFDECYSWIGGELKALGIALETIVRELYQLILLRVMPNEQKTFIVNRLGDIEYRLSLGCQEKLCLASLVGAFVEIRELA
jgi:replication factor C subunit 3/5